MAALHHDRIKQRFGLHRRFIRCDQFPASSAHFLRKLSNVIGAGVENPEDLTPLRAFLSSKKMVIVLDNAESILDPQVADAQGIYAVVEELSQFDNICLCITSRISITPPDCKCFDVPTLSIDAAQDTFYQIYGGGDRSDLVNGVLEQLDFHPLSITLLATVAHQNRWDMDRLTREWERRRTSVLKTQHNKSLAAAIELSLASPMFQELGPEARALLGIVAFFPQGVNENNLEWLFPTILNGTEIFDKFCVLSLAYRSNGFVTMLAPLRDYLSPKDPKASPLLCATKEHYFSRLSVIIEPAKPNFGESRWIISEDINVERLLDIFTTIDPDSSDVWDTCANFVGHLFWHRKRLTVLGPKIEGLSDDHRSKPDCLIALSQSFDSVGNWVEQKRLLVCALDLCRRRGCSDKVALVLALLSEANQGIGLHEEGIWQTKEALEIHKWLGDTGKQARDLTKLASLLCSDKQFDAAEEAAFRALALLPESGDEYRVCQCHRVLGEIYQTKGDTKKAIHHLGVVIGIATSFNWNDDLFATHHRLAYLFHRERMLDDAQAHNDRAKSYAGNVEYHLGAVMVVQALIWFSRDRLGEARTEVLRAVEILDRLGAASDAEICRELLQAIEERLFSMFIALLLAIVSRYAPT